MIEQPASSNRPPRRGALLPLAAAIALAAAACGQGGVAASPTPPASTGAAASIPAGSVAPVASGGTAQAGPICGLIPVDDITAATSFDAGAGEGLPGDGFFDPGCRWTLDTGSTVAGLHNVTVAVASSGGRARFDALASALQPLTGVGDRAAWSGGTTDGNGWAVIGDKLVHVTYALPVGTTEADALFTVKQLLNLVVPRI